MCASGITDLYLGFPDDAYDCLSGLEHCILPCLRELELETPLTGSVFEFLRQNRTICSFYTPSAQEGVIWPRSCLGPFVNLVNYKGPGELMPFIIPGSPVQSVNPIMYLKPGLDAETALSAMSQSSVAIQSLEFITNTWSVQFLEGLVRHAPEMITLEYYHMEYTEKEVDNDSVSVRMSPLLVVARQLTVPGLS